MHADRVIELLPVCPIFGLDTIIHEAQLDDYLLAASCWCEEQGALTLEEVS